MKTYFLRLAQTGIVVAGLLGFSINCRAQDAGDPLAARAKVEQARAEVENVRSNIFITLVELDKMRGKANSGDPQFTVFTNQMARMQDVCKALSARAGEMRDKGRAYFADWAARNASAEKNRPESEKKKSRQDSYEAMYRHMQDARNSFKPFLESMTKIQGLIEKGTTDASRAEAKELFMQANWRCMDVQRALLEIERELDSLLASDQPPSA